MWETVTTFAAPNSTNASYNTQVTGNTKNINIVCVVSDTLRSGADRSTKIVSVLEAFSKESSQLTAQESLEFKKVIGNFIDQGNFSEETIGNFAVNFEKKIQAHQKLVVYLELEEKRNKIAKSITHKCYDEFAQLYDDEYIDEAIKIFSGNLRFCLNWLYESLKAGCDIPLKKTTKKNLESFNQRLYQESFRQLEEKIRKDFVDSHSEKIKVVQSYTKALLEKLW